MVVVVSKRLTRLVVHATQLDEMVDKLFNKSFTQSPVHAGVIEVEMSPGELQVA